MLGQPALSKDARYTTAEARSQHLPELMQQVQEWFAARTYAEAEQALEAHQVPYSRIMSMADIFADPHYQERQMLIDVPHPTLGALSQPGVVPKLSRSPGRISHAGPALGEHTDDILGSLLGLSAAEVVALRQEGII
jgi:crotonobetainyl-CoA:carnitine CoA-transferase CaiB-like acyl-CoA transferase